MFAMEWVPKFTNQAAPFTVDSRRLVTVLPFEFD